MNPLLLPEYLMERFRKWSEKVRLLREEGLMNNITVIGLAIVLGIFLSGAPYVVTYFDYVRKYYDTPLLYGYGLFFLPRSAGDPLSQTTYEMIYVLISYTIASISIFILAKGSKSISRRNILTMTGIVLLVISLLLIVGLDYLKLYTNL